jgi:hypothetical protein
MGYDPMGVARLRVSLQMLTLCLLLAGCNGQSQPAQGSAAASYFPMVPDARWVYALRSSVGQLEIEVTARGEMPLPQDRGDVFVMDEKNLGPRLGFAEVAPVGYVATHGYIARISAIDYDASGSLRLLGQDEPTWILPLDPEPGHSWGQQTAMFQTPEGGGAQLGWSGEVKPRTTVTVPAGRFEDVVEIETLYRDASEGKIEAKVIYRDYYARGVGLVRTVTEDPSGNPTHRIEQVLLEYHFPR